MNNKTSTDSWIVQKKEELAAPPNYVDPKEVELKINAVYVNLNARDECYREIMINYIRMLPILEKQVELAEADYIIYMHSFARVDDMGDAVVQQIKYIAKTRKAGAEIIVVGKACNAKALLGDEIDNITYYQEDFVEKLAKRFNFDSHTPFCGRWSAYDDEKMWLAMWPVDGCKGKCGFCRRSYMHIPFKSIPMEDIRYLLDECREKAPLLLSCISLRAENLAEYGLDLYGEPSLYKILELFNEYPEIKAINLPIGLAIGELTEKDIDAICNLKAKIKLMHISLETGTDRLLKLIGKKHTIDSAKQIITRIRRAHPSIFLDTTVMVGIPTETLADIDALAELLVELEVDRALINYCVLSPRAPLYKYPQLSPQLVEYHNARLISLIKHEIPSFSFHEHEYVMHLEHWCLRRNRRKKQENCAKFNQTHPELYPIHMGKTTALKFQPSV